MDTPNRTSTVTDGSLSSGVIDMRSLIAASAPAQRASMPTLDLALSIGGARGPLAPVASSPIAAAPSSRRRTVTQSLGVVCAVALAGVVGYASAGRPNVHVAHAVKPAIAIPIAAQPAPSPSPAPEVVAVVEPAPASPERPRRPSTSTSTTRTVETASARPVRSNEPATLEELMHRATSGSEPTVTPVSLPGGASLPATPTRDEVRAAMQAVTPAVRACVEGSGQASVFVVVAGPTGHVRSANVTGDFAGTPEGSCIARAVREADFPRFERATFSFTYPFAF